MSIPDNSIIAALADRIEHHNRWRSGDDMTLEPSDPMQLSRDLDLAVKILRSVDAERRAQVPFRPGCM